MHFYLESSVGVSCSTISRELRRNCDLRSGKYIMDLAQRKADERKRSKRRKQVFTDTMKWKCRELLSKDYSPEQITGRCKLEGVNMVSHEVIYRWIWADKRKGGDLHTHLRRQSRKYVKRGSNNAGREFISNRVDIDERNEIVEKKLRLED